MELEKLCRQLMPYHGICMRSVDRTVADMQSLYNITLITSRLDYCNSLLANLTNTQMKRLKSIQHKAACLVTRTPLREHITPVLKQLHWLPVECRITYKLMVLVYKCVHEWHCPSIPVQAYSAKMSRQPLTPTKRSGVASSGPKEGYRDCCFRICGTRPVEQTAWTITRIGITEHFKTWFKDSPV